MPDAGRTREPCVQRKCTLRTQATTGQPEPPDIPCAMVLTLITCSPRRPGFDCLRRLKVISLRLNPSIGGPGPHAFAVRERCLRRRAQRALNTLASTAPRFQRP